jgi:hypothetical protein
MICSRPEFCELAGISNANLTTYVNRGKLVLEPDRKTIDTERRENKDFLESRKNKGKGMVGSTVQIIAAPEIPAIQQQVIDPKVQKKVQRQQLTKYELDIEKTKAELEKKLVDTELAREKLAALRGNNIPIGIVKDIISQLSKSIINNYKSNTEQQINEICHKFGISDKDRSDILSKGIRNLNTIHEKAVIEARKQLRAQLTDLAVSQSYENDEPED